MTATGKEAQIAEALFARVATLVTGSPTLPVSYPEPAATFAPPADGKYLDVSYFPNKPQWEGITSGAMDQGLLQITVVWPKNLGVIAPLQVAATVMAHFPKALSLSNGTTRVKISAEPWAGAPIPADSENRTAITIPWTA
jgi:hypothetical protein